jgi:putative membrane protein
MQQRSILSIFIGSVLLFAGCGDTANKAANTAGSAANTLANAVTTVTTDSPETFVKSAAQGSMADVEMSKLATTQAKDAEIKKFAQMMVTDHSTGNAELEKVAASKKIDVPKDMGSHQAFIDKLKKLSGADFDRYYAEQMFFRHETKLKAYQKQAESGSDPEVKAFAAKGVPVIQKHLDAINAIRDKMK